MEEQRASRQGADLRGRRGGRGGTARGPGACPLRVAPLRLTRVAPQPRTRRQRGRSPVRLDVARSTRRCSARSNARRPPAAGQRLFGRRCRCGPLRSAGARWEAFRVGRASGAASASTIATSHSHATALELSARALPGGPCHHLMARDLMPAASRILSASTCPRPRRCFSAGSGRNGRLCVPLNPPKTVPNTSRGPLAAEQRRSGGLVGRRVPGAH